MRLVSIVVSLAAAQSGWAHVGPTIPIQEVDDADVARIDVRDVSTADWEAVVGPPALTCADFAYYDSPYDPANLDCRVWLAWHDASDRLLGAVEFADDVYEPNAAPFYPAYLPFWGKDGTVHVKADGDHSGGMFIVYNDQLDPSDYNRNAQHYAMTAEVARPTPRIGLGESGYGAFGWFSEPPFADAGGGHFGEQPTIYAVEYYLTLFDDFDETGERESVPSDLRPWRIIGVSIGLEDHDVPWDSASDTYESIMGFPTIGGWGQSADADLLADGMLIPRSARQGAPGEPIAAPESWARIKAAFAPAAAPARPATRPSP